MGTAIDIAESLPVPPQDEAREQCLILAKDKAFSPRLGHIAQGTEHRAGGGLRRIDLGVMRDDVRHRLALANAAHSDPPPHDLAALKQVRKLVGVVISNRLHLIAAVGLKDQN